MFFVSCWRKAVLGILSAALLICSMALSGCSSNESTSSQIQSDASSEPETTDEYYVDAQQMEQVLEEIYQDYPELLLESVSIPTDEEIEEVLKLTPSYIDDAYIRYSSGSFGLADVYVIKPTSSSGYAVYEELEELRERRISEFEQYDVYDALKIAENSEVQMVGNYVVLLMLENADEALEKLEPIIPTPSRY